VAGFAGSWYIQRDVVRIDTLVVIGLVAGSTGIGGIVVITLVTIITRGGQVCPGQWPVGVAEGRWYPGTLSVTLLAVQRELLCFVIRIGCIVVIIRVTPGTRIRCIVVIAVVTGRAIVGNGRVRSDQLIEVIVYREGGGCPSRIGCVACFTGCGQVQRQVIRIYTLVVVRCMTSRTGVGCVAVIPLMTVVASRTRVRARKRPETVVEGRRGPCILCVTIRTGCRELLGHVVRVRRIVIVVSMAARTGIGCVAVVPLVAVIATHTGMCSHYRIK